MACPCFEPIICDNCERCGGTAGVASGATTTSVTSSGPTEIPANAGSAATDSLRTGTSSPYFDILVDLVAILHESDDVDMTPLLQIAAMAIELELAERLLDAAGNTAAG